MLHNISAQITRGWTQASCNSLKVQNMTERLEFFGWIQTIAPDRIQQQANNTMDKTRLQQQQKNSTNNSIIRSRRKKKPQKYNRQQHVYHTAAGIQGKRSLIPEENNMKDKVIIPE